MIDVSRYKTNDEIKIKAEFVTPAFLGGADKEAEFRVAPFKSGIRYWWRVLYGWQYGNDIKKIEDSIFGSTDRVSSLRLKLTIPNEPKNCISFEKLIGKKFKTTHQGHEILLNILDYLAFGKCTYDKVLHENKYSSYIKADTSITLTLKINNSEYSDQIKDAAKLFFKYGGIGGRSRNGFGSMFIKDGDYNFSKKVTVSNELLEIPVISKKSKFFITSKKSENWEDALSEVGIAYQSARTSLEKKHSFERRGLVARPIEARNENIPLNIKKDRRPKTFYLGVQKTDDGFQGYIICLPIKFHEANKQNEYMKVYQEMTESFSQKLSDKTNEFLAEIAGKKND